MNDIAVHVESLGKRYQIGAREIGNTSFREAISGLVTAPWRRFRRLSGHTEPDEEFWALRNITFDIARGEVLGVIGPNGAGKSTLLKILSRITPPTEGHAEIEGRVSSLLEVGTGFHPELTGRENIFLNGAILGMSRSDTRARFDDIVDFAELSQFIDTPVKRYSSGMFVRLAFSVAAHLEPEILIVDEVLAVGDLHFRNRCLGRMQHLRGEGRTVLFVSHDMTSIRQLCTRALLLDHGGVTASGSPHEVTHQYEQHYRSGASSRTGAVDRTDSPRGYHLRRAELRNGSGEPSGAFRAGDTMEIHLWSSDRAPERSFTVEFRLRNQDGTLISYGAANPLSNTYYEPADRHFVCSLGPLPLTEGSYTFDFIIRVWNRARWDFWDQAIGFDITRCDPFSTGHSLSGERDGDFVIPQKWSKGNE
jgi:homopolymeric O-antigen transport system ATP-binding protein